MATHTDAMLEALVERLRTVLPDLVAAANLPPVLEFLNYDPSVPQPTKAPTVWVDVVADARSASEARGATLHKYSHQPTVLVGVTCAGADAAVAARRLRQYVDLVKECVEGDPTCGGHALWVRWQKTDYSPNMANSGLFKEAVLTFDINRRTRMERA